MGDAEALYERPRTRFAGQFLGSVNLIDATVVRRLGNEAFVQTEVGELRVTLAGQTSPAAQQDKFTLAIRPEKVNLCAPTEATGENRFKVRVEELIYIGSETHYILRCGAQTLTAEMMNIKVGSQGFDIGQEAVVYLPPAGLIVLDD